MRCLVLFSIISLLLAGCAGTQVHSMATGSAAYAAYELKGRSLFVLERQADALCPQGHVVVRQWESQRRPAADAGTADRYWVEATGWLRPSEADQAQMTVQCRA